MYANLTQGIDLQLAIEAAQEAADCLVQLQLSELDRMKRGEVFVLLKEKERRCLLLDSRRAARQLEIALRPRRRDVKQSPSVAPGVDQGCESDVTP
jgi:hypothetical protein